MHAVVCVCSSAPFPVLAHRTGRTVHRHQRAADARQTLSSQLSERLQTSYYAVRLGAACVMSIHFILDKISEVAGALIAFFILFFMAGFIYGVEKTRNARIDDIIGYLKIDLTDGVPTSLSLSCSSSRPSYVFSIPAKSFRSDPAAKEQALLSFKKLIADAVPSDPEPFMTTSAGLLGFGTAWKAFKEGDGNIKEGLIIAFGAVFGAPFGYLVSTNWMKMNCPSEDLFQLLDKDEIWDAIVDKLFLRAYDVVFGFCYSNVRGETKRAAILKRMRDDDFNVAGRRYSYEDFLELKAISEACEK